jgi:hypothetical protein
VKAFSITVGSWIVRFKGLMATFFQESTAGQPALPFLYVGDRFHQSITVVYHKGRPAVVLCIKYRLLLGFVQVGTSVVLG